MQIYQKLVFVVMTMSIKFTLQSVEYNSTIQSCLDLSFEISSNSTIDFFSESKPTYSDNSKLLLQAAQKRSFKTLALYARERFIPFMLFGLVVVLCIFTFLLSIICIIKPCACCSNPTEFEAKKHLLSQNSKDDKLAKYASVFYYQKYIDTLDRNFLSCRRLSLYFLIFLYSIILIFGFLFSPTLQ